MFQFLFEHGANVEAKNDDSHTPLHLAALEDHVLFGLEQKLLKLEFKSKIHTGEG
jgi:ankyrin repeat protein